MNDSLKFLRSWKHKLSVGLFSMLNLTIGIDIASAQVTVDPKLSASGNTQVNFTPSNGVYEITGGATPSGNDSLLFHSFDSFSLESGRAAFFNHGIDIETILSRVTGRTSSQIDGIIRVGVNGVVGTSNADLFIINPRGIVFGPNAALEIGGSFIASTADRIVFADGIEFSASDPQPVALLTVSQPIGLSLGEFFGSIVNESTAPSSILLGDSAGLTVLPGQAIMLVSNEISLLGGRITSPSGELELASLGPGSSVNLISPDSNDRSVWALDYGDENYSLGDIKLSSGALIYGTDFGISGSPNSHIRLRGRRVSLDRSSIFADNGGTDQGEDFTLSASEQLTLRNGSLISASTSSSGAGGNLDIEVAEGTVELLDSSLIQVAVSPYGSNAITAGSAGRLTLNAASLRLQDESRISTSTSSQGDGGNLDINVLGGTVELLGNSRLLAQSNRNATGGAGTLTINTDNLSVREGAVVSTTATGNGRGGNLVINTFGGSVEVAGIFLDDKGEVTGSVLSATTQGSQDAGEIQIHTGILLVQDGGQIQAGTFGSGDGGLVLINATESIVATGQSSNFSSQISSTTAAPRGGDPLSITGNSGPVKIVTNRLEVSEGATIFTTSSSSGRGGDLTVEANEVVLSGQNSSSTQRSGLYARARGAGDSGTVNLTANTLRIENGARLTVSNRDIDEPLTDNFPTQDFGTVRDANIKAQRITLNNGEITAESLSGNGGSLNFNVQDVILLRNNSLISATAGTDSSGGNGGNVTINIPDGFFIATPNENSDIIANAFSGTGGNIDITARNIIGADARQAIPDNGTNDIDASSEFGDSGTISLNNFELDPTEGLVELPASPATPDQVAQRCLADSEGRSAFVITGQGGTAPNPGDVVRNEAIGWVDLGRTAPSVSRSERQASPVGSTTSPEPTSSEPLVEAQGWQQDSNGTVTLIAQLPSTQAVSRAQYSSCAHQSKR